MCYFCQGPKPFLQAQLGPQIWPINSAQFQLFLGPICVQFEAKLQPKPGKPVDGPNMPTQVEWLARPLPRAMLPQALFPSRVQAQFATAWSLTRLSAEHTPATYNHISLEISFCHARIRLAANLHMRAHGFYMKTSYCHDGFPSAELCLQHQVYSRPMDKLCAQSFCMHMSSTVKFQLFSSSIPVN